MAKDMHKAPKSEHTSKVPLKPVLPPFTYKHTATGRTLVLLRKNPKTKK